MMEDVFDNKVNITDEMNFYEGNDAFDLVERFGSPLYVYNERVLRTRSREIKNLVSYKRYKPHYSVKSNSNPTLLKIIKSEGLAAEALTNGEILACLTAGYTPADIFYVTNNAHASEIAYALNRGVTVSADCLAQLEKIGQLNHGGRVAVRFNPGIGAGHSESVITGGENTKFGVDVSKTREVKHILEKYGLTLIGINQHIGSQFMDYSAYLQGSEALLKLACEFDTLEFVDLGGGFGIPYHKSDGEKRLDMRELGARMDDFIVRFIKETGNENIAFHVEPGRYVCAEAGVLLGTVNAVKTGYKTKYVGTDLGFTTLIRPTLYDSYHDVEVYKRDGSQAGAARKELVSVVGNVCESGDYIAKDRYIPFAEDGDIIAVLDAGAYGYCMSMNYNNRPRPAEVLIRENGETVLIRRRETLHDVLSGCPDVLL